MKLKYYLRGLGVGIIVTTIILAISFSGREKKLSDAEVMARAAQLGMVMPEETETDEPETQETEAGNETDSADAAAVDEQNSSETEAGNETDVAQQPETEQSAVADGDVQSETEEPEESAQDAQPDGTQPPVSANAEGETYRLVITKGQVCRDVCEDLAANGVVEDAEALRQYLGTTDYPRNMSTGQYDIPYGLTMEEVALVLQAGPVAE